MKTHTNATIRITNMSTVTKEKVFAACERIEANNEKLTQSAVRKILNGGSFTDISPLFNEYKERKAEAEGLQDEPLPADMLQEVQLAAKIIYKRAKENSLMLYKNVDATLHALSKIGLKLAVVSDAPSREAWIRICTVKLEHTFDAVVTLHDKGFHKPSPEPFNQVIKSLNIKAEEILMVGDWPERDIIGAQNVGMKTAFAKYGDTFDTQNSGADYVLEDISDLIDIINKTNN